MSQEQHTSQLQQTQPLPARVVQVHIDVPVRIGETSDAYGMRVKLPGTRADYCQVRVNVGSLGLIQVEAMMTNPQILQEIGRKNNLSEHETVMSGHFCLSVQLPGRIVSDPLMMLEFKPNGHLEAIFRKDIYGDPWAHWPFPENNAQVCAQEVLLRR